MNYVKSEKNAVIICYKLTSLVFFNKEISENRWKSIKIANIDREFLHNFYSFWKNVAYYNIKSHKKSRFHPLFRRYTFWKVTGGRGILTPFHPAILGLKQQHTWSCKKYQFGSSCFSKKCKISVWWV